jgi:hypothetical protein
MPPCRIGRSLRPSGPAISLGSCLMTGLSGAQSVLYWRCHPIEYKMSEVPHKQGTGASQMGMVACPTFDSGHMAVACMYIDMAQVDIVVEVSMQVCWVIIGHYDMSFFSIGEVVQSVLPGVALEWVREIALLASHLGWPSFLNI